MRFVAVAETDIGKRKVNQDSILLKHVLYGKNEVLFAVVCDGIGGLSNGELASAAAIEEVCRWFEDEMPNEIKKIDMDIIAKKLSLLLMDLNVRIRESEKYKNRRSGTTFTGMLFVNDSYIAVHVGDTRLYHVSTQISQLTQDHTVASREVIMGNLTLEQAHNDKRSHILYQCVGASNHLKPQVIRGRVKRGAYLLCSDGFWQKGITNKLISEIQSIEFENEENMKKKCRQWIDECKVNGTKDNISVLVVKVRKQQ